MNILVTGGLGYIGSNTVIELVKKGHTPIIVDNLSNSTISTLSELEDTLGSKITFYNLDVNDTQKLKEVFQSNTIDSIIHFAALKAVGESAKFPLSYYHNNVQGLISLLNCLKNIPVQSFIFSSSATVYGDPDKLPISEDQPLKPATNPYGSTKQMGEVIVKDVATELGIRYGILRYFNPIGSQPDGSFSEKPNGTPNNILPYIVMASNKEIPPLVVYGNDYDTPDGTGVRDYINVCDLAAAHTIALEHLVDHESFTANIGTGKGTSVMELIQQFEKATGRKVPYTIGARRPGDIASCYADPSYFSNLTGWSAKQSILESLKSYR